MYIDNIPNVIAACCILHNICEVHQDSFDDDWIQGVEALLQQQSSGQSSVSTQTPSNTQGDEVQDILLDYFKLHP